MAKTDILCLSRREVLQMVNNCGFGPVLTLQQLRYYCDNNDIRGTNGQGISLLRYAAMLTCEYFQPVSKPKDYLEQKRLQAERNAEAVRAAQDIGAIPPVANPQRREAALGSFKTFCETYFSEIFYLPWSPDHLHVISKIERAVLNGGLFALAMPRGSGKALALDTPIATPTGWTTMGDVKVGDEVFDENGQPCRVTFATDVQRNRKCFAVEFSDGEQIICDAEHLWTVNDRYSRRNPLTLPVEVMASRFILSQKRDRTEYRYRISMTKPLQLPKTQLPFEPYALGVWLGDGNSNGSGVTLNGDDTEEICLAIEAQGEKTTIKHFRERLQNSCFLRLTKNRLKPLSFQGRLRKHNLLNNKHIPARYLRASYEQRLTLLQGVMDTDGYVDALGSCEIVIKYPRFADTFGELLTTLGIKYSRGIKWVSREGKRFGPYQRFCFVVHDDFPIFRLRRKLKRLRPRPKSHPICKGRQIISITPVQSVPVRCIQVDSESQLYLAGRKMVPTHNTVICQTAVVWAAFSGATPFVCLIAASADRAQSLLENIKTWLETNELLQQDFPEVCYPIQCLERISNRQKGQKHLGVPTRIEWSADKVVLPTIAGSKASGVVISCSGMHGSEIRGQHHARPDGKVERPGLVLIDDPQTTESAWSWSQSQRREAILAGDVLGMAGPGKKIAGLMACTIIRPDDMASRILDREKHPDWQGERTKMVYAFPTNEKLWLKYAEIRAESLRNDGDGSSATEFYRANRHEMDLGARVAWQQRYNSDEISAIQHAMNLKFRDEYAFNAEYQNEPMSESLGEDMMSAEEIAAKINGLQRGVIPLDATHLTMFIDVHQSVLYWLLVAWDKNFGGYVVDYGTWPDQNRPYFSLRDAHHTLQIEYPQGGLEGSIYAGLEALCEDRISRQYYREDGTIMSINRTLIDANWGQTTDVIYQFCRQSKHAAFLYPSHGQYVGASSIPFSDKPSHRGDRVGRHWRIPGLIGTRGVRHVLIDTNYWKSFIHARLAVLMGDPGCLSFFGHDSKQHQLISEHLIAEYRVKTMANNRTVDEWKLRSTRPDNHCLDCMVGCCVAASIEGIELSTLKGDPKPKRERIRFSDRNKNYRNF